MNAHHSLQNIRVDKDDKDEIHGQHVIFNHHHINKSTVVMMVDKNNSGLNMIPDHNPQDNQSFVTTKNLSFQARIPPFDSESIFKIGCVGKFEL